jgi:competence protein ComEC
LAGAQPSILRAAIMFTFIAISENTSRKPNILNSLASSAFVLLCINPFWLWDIGFQLSYTAVLSIILFMKPVYACLYLPNRALDLVWQMVAVTIAAQLLTFPLCIFYFHQFPTYFILTNLVAIPLSTLILFAEILLCGLSALPIVATLAGELITAGIRMMNSWIRHIEMIPGALLDEINCSIPQVILLFGIIITAQYGLIKRKINALKFSLLLLLLFFLFRSYSFYQAMRQQLMIVYNVPGKQAIDLISSRKYLFRGNLSMAMNPDERDFYLMPTRTYYRTLPAVSLPIINKSRDHLLFNKTKIWIPVGSTVQQSAVKKPQVVDICIISGRYRGSIADLINRHTIKQFIFDSSTRPWQMAAWKKECEEQKISYHDVREEGAFVINIP